jgi:2-oxo-4-hydroxy-4-carboxy-5-ureidoimidazoline decarboxylase
MTSLTEFNALSSEQAARILDSCLDIDTWVDELMAGRPYESVDALQARGTEASAKISWEQVATALARHPRIGEKPAGTGANAVSDAAMSAREQSGVQSSQLGDLASGNAAYEARFGHIFLICAAGLSGEQMLAALRQRLTNDDETEHVVVISELRKIAALRLAAAVTPGAAAEPASGATATTGAGS